MSDGMTEAARGMGGFPFDRPGRTKPKLTAKHIVECCDLIEANGGLKKAERKLEVLEEVRERLYVLTDPKHFSVGTAALSELAGLVDMIKNCTSSSTTVGDLAKHTRVRLIRPDYSNNIAVIAEHQSTVQAKNPHDIIMVYKDSRMIISVPKSTPCKIVEEEK